MLISAHAITVLAHAGALLYLSDMAKKSSTRHDITGRRFGRLIVAERIPGLGKYGHAYYRCVCDCGGETTTKAAYLRDGRTTSCGCFSRESASLRATTHGLSKHALFPTWVGMMGRCYNPSDAAYPDYGGRGIYVCSRWHDVRVFIHDNADAHRHSFSIDRIDNDGPYSPENCRWADRTTQSNNRRSNVMLEYAGKTQTLTEWASEIGIPKGTLWARIQVMGWDIERALTSPVG